MVWPGLQQWGSQQGHLPWPSLRRKFSQPNGNFKEGMVSFPGQPGRNTDWLPGCQENVGIRNRVLHLPKGMRTTSPCKATPTNSSSSVDTITRAEKRTLLVKCTPFKHEQLSPIPREHIKPSAGEVETVGSLTLPDKSPWPNSMLWTMWETCWLLAPHGHAHRSTCAGRYTHNRKKPEAGHGGTYPHLTTQRLVQEEKFEPRLGHRVRLYF